MTASKRAARVLAIAALCLTLGGALGGCHKQQARSDDQRTAEGQVLKGSISDAMLPYDTVTSQPPLAPEEISASAASGAATADSADQAASADAGSAESGDAPASASPTASPAP